MRRIYAIAGVGILGACLAGWAALALAQQAPAPARIPVVAEAAVGSAPAPVGVVAPVPAPVPMTPDPVAQAPLPVPLPPPPGIVGSDPVLSQARQFVNPVTDPTPVVPVPLSPAVTSPPAPMPVVPTTPPSSVTVLPVDRSQIAPPMPLTHETRLPVTIAEEKQPEPSTTQENPTGRQEPAVSIEWIGPPSAKVGQPGDYTLIVRNICNISVQQVQVRVRVPSGMQIVATEPKAESEGNVLVWNLSTLLAKQEKNLQMKLMADAKGDLMPQAWITFTGTSVMRVKVREPKLVLKATATEKVLVGDAAAFTLTVTNPGDGAADQVNIHAVLSEGLEHAKGNKFDFPIGNLSPGESRSVQVICGTKTGGQQKCECSAEAEGGMKATDAASVNVIVPRLDMQITGPGLKYLERKALYTLKVTNPGDAPATNVTVSDVVPNGFKVLAASDGGRHDFSTRAVSWFLGEVGPGQTRQVQLEVQAINPGEFTHKASAIGARGLRSESQCITKVEGLSALLIELVDTEDPIEVGGDTAYEVRITNTGSKTETDIKLIATVPDKMEFKGAQAPVRFRESGKTIEFEPIEKLAPKADCVVRINVKALEAGTVRFQIKVASANLTEPIIKMEPTRIYSDAPETPAATSRPMTVTPPGLLPPSAPMPPE